MYMARIDGWTEVIAFSDSLEKAKKLAISSKKNLCRSDGLEWTWEGVSSFYGADVVEIKDGVVVKY